MINKKSKNKIVEKDVAVVKVIAYVVLSVMSILARAPFVILLSASFSSEASLAKDGYGFFPTEFSTAAWEYLWQARGVIFKAYGLTIVVTALGTVLSVFISSMFAYGLIQRLKINKALMVMLVITMIFSGGMVSSYYVWAQWFNIRNTFMALVFPNLLTSAFTIILIMSYYKSSIPSELLEAARIDGAGEFRIYFNVILPLSVPILATVALMQALLYWNNWTNGYYFIYGRHTDLYTIQHLLNQMNQEITFLQSNPNFQLQAGTELPQSAVRMAIAFIGVLPIIVSFPFFQKYFAKGLMLGGVKG